MRVYNTRIDLPTDFGALEGVPAVFHIDRELVSLHLIKFNGLHMDPHDSIKAFGHRAIALAETEIECRLAEAQEDAA